MALNSRGSVDPRWITHNRSVALSLHLATVEIYNPNSAGQTYNVETNDWSGTKTVKWTGQARVQPINATSELPDPYNPTLFKNVRVQIAYGRNTLAGSDGEMPDIRPNDKMLVTASPYDETLTKFVYVVTDVLNSSNPWEKTLLCRVDTELDPTVTS